MQIEPKVGAAVITKDGKELGIVKKLEGNAFLVDAPKQFDYWLEVSLVVSEHEAAIGLSINEGELSGYKMDRPNDHNGFRESHAANLDPAQIRAQTVIQGTPPRP